MSEDKKKRLAELEAELKELKKRNPAHCGGTASYVGHQMTPALLEKIENAEEEIAQLRKELGSGG